MAATGRKKARGFYLGHYSQLVRLLRDINVEKLDGFCEPNITLSDYIPDRTGILSDLKRSLCEPEPDELFKELPPLVFASQGYSDSLQLSRDVNYTSLELDVAKTESLLNLNQDLQSPQRPYWVTEDKLNSLRKVAIGLLSKETLTSIAFGFLSNIVDAGTLFLNDGPCKMCSYLTCWIKQLNLQVFKKQEYDSLLCRLDDMRLEDIYHTLKNDFHWDMALRELILPRNYTKYELNKSLNEFLELVKLHLLEDMLADTTKLTDCLARNVTRNAFGNATLYVSILSKTARLLRAQVPHLQEVDGLTSLPYFKELEMEVAHNLHVYASPKKYMAESFAKQLRQATDDRVVEDIVNGDFNLQLLIDNKTSIEKVVTLRQNSWKNICDAYDCNKIDDVISSNVNYSLIRSELLSLQTKEFWKFNFISNILKRIEDLLHHMSKLLAVVSKMDVQGVMEGRLASLIDFVVTVMSDVVSSDLLFSLEGLITDLHPLLEDSSLEHDMKALATGLNVMKQLRNYLVEKEDLRVDINKYFPQPEHVELGLERLGINNTNFWSIAAPRIQAGYIHLKPVCPPYSSARN
ncbi:uncharacterized protein LOC113227657 [Hyposmocoma kahamanoa]|uniref:uncharacterized protein LOC113227657 n=1 Tax=Hyposmocoma kahamanoa TaxID=1477025 RepID=UPI000E6D6311|nr:uncharacterized protein LOC113227657 [Hyposmocoma kahamanoa]